MKPSELFHESSRNCIELAYDSFDKKEFLKRLYSYIESTIELAAEVEANNFKIMNSDHQERINLVKDAK